MTQAIEKPASAGTRWDSAADRGSLLRPGVVFVPCALCTSPVDLARLRFGNQPQLCEHHLRTDTVQR